MLRKTESDKKRLKSRSKTGFLKGYLKFWWFVNAVSIWNPDLSKIWMDDSAAFRQFSMSKILGYKTV